MSEEPTKLTGSRNARSLIAGREPRRAADQQRGQVAAVRAAHDADPVGVERRVGQRVVEEGEHVGGVELAEAARIARPCASPYPDDPRGLHCTTA